ncbi:MAG: hypothetical protein JST00_21790 [Deltaproteobacteria bacterium]|nr:hypothetical protein [Deltaproteobacteria bacterium]
MRFNARRTLTLAAAGLSALVYSGCESKLQTQYVAGVSTQVQVPRDIKSVRLDIAVGGASVFCRAYRVYDGKVLLPRSLGSFPANVNNIDQPVTFTVVGFTEELTDPTRGDEFECLKQIKAGENARILRRSRQPYKKDAILFLPMALRYSCFDKDCETTGQDKTCKGGRCVDAAINKDELPTYSDELLDGTGSTCFSAKECFAASVPPVVVDPKDCTYSLPKDPSQPPQVPGTQANPFTAIATGDGINVEVTYDGGSSREILDKDPEEGFTIPDPTKPQRFRLAPGLCDLVKGVDEGGQPTKHRITQIRASGVCRAKGKYQPLCAGDQLEAMGVDAQGLTKDGNVGNACSPKEIKPSKSILMFLVDDTSEHRIFFEGSDKAAIEISLQDPAFQSTDVGVVYFPGTGTCPANFVPDPTVGIKNAIAAKDPIIQQLSDRGDNVALLKPADPQNMDGALAAAYAFLQKDEYKDYNRRGVLLFTNRNYGANQCGAQTPATLAGNARTNARSVSTYVVALARRPSEDVNALAPLPAEAAQIASLGSGTIPYDARTNKSAGADGFRKVVEELATCAYDVDTAPADTDTLSYSDPLKTALPGTTPAPVAIPFNAGCNSDTATAPGWGRDAANPKRVRICGAPCSAYRDVLKNAAGYAALYKQPAIAVPVFIHKQGCGPK